MYIKVAITVCSPCVLGPGSPVVNFGPMCIAVVLAYVCTHSFP